MMGTAPIHAAAPPDRESHLTADARQASVRARRASLAGHASGRRRQVDPATCERDYTPAELEFMNAMQAYKARSGRPFPTWSETLEVLVGLGYRKAVAGGSPG
jgi:hypothetical protein